MKNRFVCSFETFYGQCPVCELGSNYGGFKTFVSEQEFIESVFNDFQDVKYMTILDVLEEHEYEVDYTYNRHSFKGFTITKDGKQWLAYVDNGYGKMVRKEFDELGLLE